ncbi:MAG: hemolysin family protein [Patescibacteria group bacterium]|nr:hemolysin family protein [Patescibacteria group bacterium]
MELLIFIGLLVLSSFFSSTETAYFSLQPSRIRLMQQKKQKNADLVYKLKSHPQRLLITVLIGNNIVNLFAASFATIVAVKIFGSIGLGIATGATTLLVLIFGEIMPKSLAYSHSVAIARMVAKPLFVIYILLYPISSLLLKVSRLINYTTRSRLPQKGITEEEIRIMSRMGVENGEIDFREHQMIENIFRFDDIEVGDIMTPKYKVEFLNGMVPVQKIAHFISHSGYSRFPVYANNTDNIMGYVYVNQIMKALNSDKRDQPVSNLVLPVTVVDERMKIERAFRSMKKDQEHLYLVHRANNPEEIIGLVTLEDILEEIVGEIADETDERLHKKRGEV